MLKKSKKKNIYIAISYTRTSHGAKAKARREEELKRATNTRQRRAVCTKKEVYFFVQIEAAVFIDCPKTTSSKIEGVESGK